MIPYGRQSISDDDIAAVEAVLRSDFLTQGPAVPRFETALASHCGAAHAVAVSNATAALHAACHALGVGPGDMVWTSPITFVASVNCARYCQADVDFVDIDADDGNMSPVALADKLDHARSEGRLPKVVIPVHLAGEPCDMQAIAALAAEYGFRVVEDASHAVGGAYHGIPVGACSHSDITVFSFHPVKIVTTGEGGMALTNDGDLAAGMSRFRTHGIIRDDTLMTRRPDGPWYYQQVELGYNYRMTDMQAALGLSQLSRLEQFIERRHHLARRYDGLLSELPVTPLRRSARNRSALHLYIVRLNTEDTRPSHREVFERLRSGGIGVNLHYIPVHLQPYYEALGFREGDFPEAERYYRQAISLPMFPTLTEHQQDQVVRQLTEALCA